MNLRDSPFHVLIGIACLLLATPMAAQEPAQVLQDKLKELHKEVELKNSKIQSMARDRTIENLLNWKDPTQLRTAYDYRNVNYFDLDLMRDSAICNRLDRLFARYYPGYFQDANVELDDEDLTDEEVTPPDRVSRAAFRVYVANDAGSVSLEHRRRPEIIELRVLKFVERPAWDRRKNRWVYKKVLWSTQEVRYSTGSYLRFILNKDSSLYRDVVETISRDERVHHMPEQMFRVSSRGPFVVKSDSLRSLYSGWYTGFAVEPWKQVRIDSSVSRLDTTRIDTQVVRVVSHASSWSNANPDTVKKDTTLLKVRQTWIDTSFTRRTGSKVFLDVSFFRVLLPFRTWSMEASLGNEELGYPFWSSGQLNLLVGYQNSVKLGIALPVGVGRNQQWQLIGPARLRSRALNGIYGLTGKFDLRFGFPFSIGGNFSMGSIEEGYKSLTNQDGFYYIPMAIQFYYPLLFSDLESDSRLVFRLRVGYGYHRIDSGHVTLKPEISKTNNLIGESEVGSVVSWTKREFNSPYVSFELMNLRADYRYGFSFQYYGGSVIVGTWVELFRDIFRIEGKYLTLLREKEPWDSSPILWFSPRIRLDLNRWFK